MNRSDLIEMVKNHSWSGTNDSSGLYEIISLYPWFQSVYTLLLDAEYSSDSLTFEESLKKNAVFVANREVLYYILKDSDNNSNDPVSEEISPAPELDDQGLRSREELVSQIESRLAELEKASKADNADEAEKKDVNREVVSESNQDFQEENGILLLDEGEDIVAGYEDSAFANDTEDGKGDISETENEMDLLDLDYPGPGSEKLESSSANDLVDRFIELNPRIQPTREKMDGPIEDIAEKVEDKNPGLITETLAKIYINQKFYTKAILIYEKLSLKFPEKSSYFATQIEKIKELIS